MPNNKAEYQNKLQYLNNITKELMKQMKKIILNWMPPAMINVPSPSMSVLKKYLTVNGYDVTIIYWNIKLLKLQQDFLWGNMSVGLVNEFLSELIFYTRWRN